MHRRRTESGVGRQWLAFVRLVRAPLHVRESVAPRLPRLPACRPRSVSARSCSQIAPIYRLRKTVRPTGNLPRSLSSASTSFQTITKYYRRCQSVCGIPHSVFRSSCLFSLPTRPALCLPHIPTPRSTMQQSTVFST